MKKLPKEFKKRWIAALESGEYKKGKERLQYRNTFCCLGVACKIQGVEIKTGQQWIEPNTKSIPEVIWGFVGEAGELANINDECDTFAPVIEYIKKNL